MDHNASPADNRNREEAPLKSGQIQVDLLSDIRLAGNGAAPEVYR